MSKYNVSRKEIIREIQLVELALEDEEKRFTNLRSKTEAEFSERRILDYEQHLRNLSRKLENLETEVG